MANETALADQSRTTTLLELAARCEAAMEGGDALLEHAIGYAVFPELAGWPLYTASLDAAMQLVPVDCRLASFGEDAFDDEPRPWTATLATRAGRFGSMGQRGRAATPALALCAAALRARAVDAPE